MASRQCTKGFARFWTVKDGILNTDFHKCIRNILRKFFENQCTKFTYVSENGRPLFCQIVNIQHFIFLARIMSDFLRKLSEVKNGQRDFTQRTKETKTQENSEDMRSDCRCFSRRHIRFILNCPVDGPQRTRFHHCRHRHCGDVG